MTNRMCIYRNMCVYIHKVLQRIALSHYGRWKVPRSAVTKLETQAADDLVPIQRPAGSRPKKSWYLGLSSKAEKKKKAMSQFKGSQSWGILLLRMGLSILFRPSTDRMKPTHIIEDQVLLSLLNQMLTLSRSTITDTLGFMFDQMPGYHPYPPIRFDIFHSPSLWFSPLLLPQFQWHWCC